MYIESSFIKVGSTNFAPLARDPHPQKKFVDLATMSHFIIQSDKNSKVSTDFAPNLKLEGPYEIALHSLESYYSFPNVDTKNNKIHVTVNGGTHWYDLTFAVGCYEHEDINNELQRMVVLIGGKKNDIVLEPNRNTFQTIMTCSSNVQVDFAIPNSIRTVLGFDAKIYKSGRHLSEHTVNINSVNSIFVHTNIIGSTYVNGSESPVIYSFFPNVRPGGKIIVEPRVLIYLPVSISVISRLTSWLTDQNNQPLNLRGEELTIKYHLRKCIEQ